MAEAEPRVFISYSRKDLAYARTLRDGLAETLAVWHDLKDIETGQWWSQIEQSLAGRESIEHLVLLVSPAALKSKIVEREWRLARREGKMASLVIPPEHKGCIDFEALPKWMQAQHFYDPTQPEHWHSLVAFLHKPAQVLRRPMMAPPLPRSYVHRAREFSQLKSALLDAKGEAIAITAALRGAGGFGKTVVASALARDEEIQDTYFDGVLWVTLGERPNVVQAIAELIYVLTGERSAFTEQSAAAHRLKEMLEHRQCLLVVDDVWQESHLRPFTDGAAATTRLITTRRDDVVPPQASRIVVDAMSAGEALGILAWGLEDIDDAACAGLERLASERLGEWPILLSLVNGFLRSRIERGEALDQAIGQVSERLDRRGLIAFDRSLEYERTAAVEKTVGVGLEMLGEFDRSGRTPGFHAARFGELAVFPEDVEVPIATIMRLWDRLDVVDKAGSEELLERLYGLALLQALDLKRRTVRLHDVMRRYLCDGMRAQALEALHVRLVEAYDAVNGEELTDAEERRYFFGYLPVHLAHCGQRDVVDALLIDPQWMQRKLRVVGLQGLMADYVAYARSSGAVVGRTLDLTGRIITRDERQLLPQLMGRLSVEDDAGIAELVQRSGRLIVPPALTTRYPTLLAPSSEIRRLEGQGSEISALAMIDDRRILSGASDHTLRLWDVATSEMLGRFEEQERNQGSASRIGALLALSRNEALVGSADGMLSHWNITTQTLLARWQVGLGILAMAELEPGKILLGLEDIPNGTLLLWDLAAGRPIWQGGPKFAINDFLRLDGKSRYAIACDNEQVLVWDVVNEQRPQQWEGHAMGVTCLARADDRHIVSGSIDQSLIVWDLVSGAVVHRLQGHRDHVSALIGLGQGRVVSGSRDGTLRVWDCRAGRERWRLAGQSSEIWCMAQVDNRHVVTGGSDRVLRLWCVDEPRQSHRPMPERRVLSTLTIVDGDRVVVGDAKGGLRVVHMATGEELGSIAAHRVGVAHAMILEGAIGASVDYDGAVACWDAHACRLLGGLKPRHWALPRAACAVDAARLLVAFDDGSLFLCEPLAERVEQLQLGRGDQRRSDDGGKEDAAGMLSRLVHERREKGRDPLVSENYIMAMVRMADGRILMLRRDRSLALLDVSSRTEEIVASGMPMGRELLLLDQRHAMVWSDTSRELAMIDLASRTARYLATHDDDITAMTVLAPTLVVTGARRVVRLWQMPSGHELARLECDSPIECLSGLRDGRSVLAGDMHGRLHEIEARLAG